MSFAIAAEFPLGTYRANVGEGQQDLLPSPARLQSALLAAAGQGVRAVENDGCLQPSDQDLVALTWLETHPPDGLALPLMHAHAATNTAYRDLGILNPRMRGTQKAPKRDNATVTLAESIMWLWEQEPPRPVRESLEDLCADVPYLGRSDSPVRLRTLSSGASTMTHRRDPEARLGTSRSSDVDVMTPRPGRTDALTHAHQLAARSAPPSARNDRATSDEDERRPATVTAAIGRERYVPIDGPTTAPVPWPTVWVLPIVDRPGVPPIGVEDRVRWSVAVHRALIALHGDDAPSLLTGHYTEGAPQPANRVAIQIVDRHSAMTCRLTTAQAVVVAAPRGAAAQDVAAVERALNTLRVVRSQGGSIGIVGPDDRPGPVDGDAYWQPCALGLVRCWTTAPAVPDVRPPCGRSWSLTDTVALSTGLVFRDALLDAESTALGRDARHDLLVSRAGERGLEVFDVRRLAPSDVGRFAHKVPAGMVIQPYVATLRLGDLSPDDRTWLAIGQSRHLGGGHLVPLDVDAAAVEIWRQR